MALRKLVYIDSDLVFDFRGLQFCLARAHQSLQQESINTLYNKSLTEGFRNLGIEVTKQEVTNYLSSVRPHLNSYSVLKALKDNQNTIKLISFLEQEYTEHVLQSYSPFAELIDGVEYLSYQDLLQINPSSLGTDCLYVLNDLSLTTKLRKQGLEAKHVKFPREESDELSLNHLADLVDTTQTCEFFLWKNSVVLENTPVMVGSIVSGFGRGSKDLGFPTANLELTSSVNSEGLVPGIYAATACFEGSETPYKAAVSIGWCPYYNNPEKTVEAHIMEKFEGDLYGEVLTVRLVAYLRAECSFRNVEDLIRAIGYDVKLTEELVKI